jgi:catechol 2,3-dioxygenase-like lactoylglutathione lyase family enzyme
MISLHHAHLLASDVDATIAFWREHFGVAVVFDEAFAGARNVFLRIGEGRLHLYAQPPRHTGPSNVHHLGVETDELHELVARLRGRRRVRDGRPRICGGVVRDGTGTGRSVARTVPAKSPSGARRAGTRAVFRHGPSDQA